MEAALRAGWSAREVFSAGQGVPNFSHEAYRYTCAYNSSGGFLGVSVNNYASRDPLWPDCGGASKKSFFT